MSEYDRGYGFSLNGDLAYFDFIYPRLGNRPVEIDVGLEDVRAADGIRISYDFDRDGWAIKQASTFSWEADDEKFDMDWQEVSFIPAWGRDKDRLGGGEVGG